jgi:hypothetical protein
MKKISLFLIMCIGVLSCTSQSPEEIPDGPSFFSKSYIQYFMGYEEIRVRLAIAGFRVDESTKIIDYTTSGIDPDKRYFSVSDTIRLCVEIVGANGFYNCARNVNYPDDHCLELTQKYLAKVAEIGDTSFNRKMYAVNRMAVSTLAQIKSVTVTSDKDFNAAHPASSSLNDLFTVYFNDPHALIKNNYQPIEGTYKYHPGLIQNYPVAVFKEQLSAVNFIERPFIDYRWDMVLNVAPETIDTYTFYVKVVLADDSVLEAETFLNIQGAI